MNIRYLWRTWLACLIACLPILVLLLMPQLAVSVLGLGVMGFVWAMQKRRPAPQMEAMA